MITLAGVPYGRKILCAFMAFVFALSSTGISYALPPVGTLVELSQPFTPILIKGINVHPENAMLLDFIVDPGQEKLSQEAIAPEATRLIKYFMAALAVPEDDLWVNLSPYEKDRIVPEALGQTEMGRDMLAQDYLLKQVTASLMNPEGSIGKKFWAKVYARAEEKYGTIDIPVDTFNKVWIMPAKALVYQNKGKAVVVESRLKVMLEADYLAAEKTLAQQGGGEAQEIAKDVLRSVVIPVLEEEVNAGKDFAPLRQIYHSLILAHWFRKNLKTSFLNKVYADKNKIRGIDLEDKQVAAQIWAQYVESFKKGVYNFIQEERDPVTQDMVPRKYFSGGVVCGEKILDDAVVVTEEASAGRKFSQSVLQKVLLAFRTRLNIFSATPAPGRFTGLNTVNQQYYEKITAYANQELLRMGQGVQLEQRVPSAYVRGSLPSLTFKIKKGGSPVGELIIKPRASGDLVVDVVEVDQHLRQGIATGIYKALNRALSAHQEGVLRTARWPDFKISYDTQHKVHVAPGEELWRSLVRDGVAEARLFGYAMRPVMQLPSDVVIADESADADDSMLTEREERKGRVARFFEILEVRPGDHILNVGDHVDHFWAEAAIDADAHYVGFEMGMTKSLVPYSNEDSRAYAQEHKSKGTARSVGGEFSSGKHSSSADIPERSQDMVLMLTGALSDPFPESDAFEVLQETFRVLKSKGRIVVGSFSTLEKDIAIDTFNEFIAKFDLGRKARITMNTDFYYQPNDYLDAFLTIDVEFLDAYANGVGDMFADQAMAGQFARRLVLGTMLFTGAFMALTPWGVSAQTLPVADTLLRPQEITLSLLEDLAARKGIPIVQINEPQIKSVAYTEDGINHILGRTPEGRQVIADQTNFPEVKGKLDEGIRAMTKAFRKTRDARALELINLIADELIGYYSQRVFVFESILGGKMTRQTGQEVLDKLAAGSQMIQQKKAIQSDRIIDADTVTQGPLAKPVIYINSESRKVLLTMHELFHSSVFKALMYKGAFLSRKTPEPFVQEKINVLDASDDDIKKMLAAEVRYGSLDDFIAEQEFFTWGINHFLYEPADYLALMKKLSDAQGDPKTYYLHVGRIQLYMKEYVEEHLIRNVEAMAAFNATLNAFEVPAIPAALIEQARDRKDSQVVTVERDKGPKDDAEITDVAGLYERAARAASLDDDYSIYKGMSGHNARDLSSAGEAFLNAAVLAAKGLPLRVCDLGAGAGRAVSQIRQIMQEHQKTGGAGDHWIDLVSLTKIPDNVLIKKSYDQINADMVRYFRAHPAFPLKGFKQYIEERISWLPTTVRMVLGIEDEAYKDLTPDQIEGVLRAKLVAARIPLELLFDLQEKGSEIFEVLNRPFIHQQHTGLFLSSAVGFDPGVKYDFLYEDHGAIYYSIETDPQQTLKKAFGLLSDNGVLFIDRMLKTHFDLAVRAWPAGFTGIRIGGKLIVVRENSVHHQKLQGLLTAGNQLASDVNVYEVKDLKEVIDLLNGAPSKDDAEQRTALTKMLAAFEPFLSAQGRAVKDLVGDDARNKGLKAPTVKDPQLQWYVDPLSGLDPVKEAALKKEIFFTADNQKRGVINITRGCFDVCEICQVFAAPKVMVMPYPMVLKSIQKLKEWGADKIEFYDDSDAINYHDPYYDADFGDVIAYAYQQGLEVTFNTRGWDTGNVVAQRAAEKIAASRNKVEVTISYHLFTKEVIDLVKAGREVPLELVHQFADRYTQVIRTLSPKITIISFFDGSIMGGRIKDFKSYAAAARSAFNRTLFKLIRSGVAALGPDTQWPQSIIFTAHKNKALLDPTAVAALGKGALLVQKLGGELSGDFSDPGINGESSSIVIEPDGSLLWTANSRSVVKLKDVFYRDKDNKVIPGFRHFFLKQLKDAFEKGVTSASGGQFDRLFNAYVPLFIADSDITQMKAYLKDKDINGLSDDQLEFLYKALSDLPLDTSQPLIGFQEQLQKRIADPAKPVRAVVLQRAFKARPHWLNSLKAQELGVSRTYEVFDDLGKMIEGLPGEILDLLPEEKAGDRGRAEEVIKAETRIYRDMDLMTRHYHNMLHNLGAAFTSSLMAREAVLQKQFTPRDMKILFLGMLLHDFQVRDTDTPSPAVVEQTIQQLKDIFEHPSANDLPAIVALRDAIRGFLGEDGFDEAFKEIEAIIRRTDFGPDIKALEAKYAAFVEREIPAERQDVIHELSFMAKIADMTSYYALLMPETVEKQIITGLAEEQVPAAVKGTYPFFFKLQILNNLPVLQLLRKLPFAYRINVANVMEHFALRGMNDSPQDWEARKEKVYADLEIDNAEIWSDEDVRFQGYALGYDRHAYWQAHIDLLEGFGFRDGSTVLEIGAEGLPYLGITALLFGEKTKATYVQPPGSYAITSLVEALAQGIRKIRDPQGRSLDSLSMMYGASPRVKIIQANIEDAKDLKEEKFDVVTLFSVLDAPGVLDTPNVETIIRATLGHLKEGGHLLISQLQFVFNGSYDRTVGPLKRIAREEFGMELKDVTPQDMGRLLPFTEDVWVFQANKLAGQAGALNMRDDSELTARDRRLALSVGPEQHEQLRATLVKMIADAGYKNPADMVRKVIDDGKSRAGSGSIGEVFFIPGIRDLCLKIDLDTPFKAGDGQLKITDNILPGYNVGQMIAVIGNVQVLLTVSGKAAGISQERYRDAMVDVYYKNYLKSIAEFPQSSYDRFAALVQQIEKAGYLLDTASSQNLLIDTRTQDINVIDLIPVFQSARKNLASLLAMLIDQPHLLLTYELEKIPRPVKLSIIKIAKKLIQAFANDPERLENFAQRMNMAYAGDILEERMTDVSFFDTVFGASLNGILPGDINDTRATNDHSERGSVAGLDLEIAQSIWDSQIQYYDQKFKGQSWRLDWSAWNDAEGGVAFRRLSKGSTDRRALQKIADKMMSVVRKDMEVLSVGEGQGHLARELLKRGFEHLSAVDISPANVKAARGLVQEGDAYALPSKWEKKFDAVIFNESIGGMDMQRAFEQARKVLKPGGVIIITTYDLESSGYQQDPRRSFYLHYSPDEIREALAGQGLGAINVDGFQADKKIRMHFITAQKPQAVVDGGIDLKASSLNLETMGDHAEFRLPENWRGIDINDIEGLAPVVIHISPIRDMPAYLGLN